MFRLLIDTNIWVELAKDPHQFPLIWILEDLLRRKEIALILPRAVVDEFKRLRPETVRQITQRNAGALRSAKDFIVQYARPAEAKKLVKALNDFGQKAPLMGASPALTVNRIEKMFAVSKIVDVSDAIRTRVGARAIERRAPCHTSRNSATDAVLIEVYADAVALPPMKGERFAFVSNNKKDFSGTNELEPHPDIAPLFSPRRSRYFLRLDEALKVISPAQLREVKYEAKLWEEPRTSTEIDIAIDDLYWKIWYNRNAVHLQKAKLGLLKIVDTEPKPYKPGYITKGSIKLARGSMARVVKKRGNAVKGPWTDFEWGMLNGKLSALRWVLGSEWDFLDT
jgi:hypothetical protein